MQFDIHSPACRGPINAAPWLCRFLAWGYVTRQPSICCKADVSRCPVRACLQLQDRNNIVPLQLALNDIADSSSGSV